MHGGKCDDAAGAALHSPLATAGQRFKGFDHSGKIVGKGIEIIAPPRIAGAPMGAPVIGNAAEALLRQWVHLVRPHLRSERPPRQKEQWLAAAPIPIEQTDVVCGLDIAR